jgi:hypothetical protein
MPNISASDYTAFVKAQAASLAYQNGKIPNKIQTSAQPYAIQSVLNAQLLGSKAAFLVQPPLASITLPTTVSAARNDILSAAVGDGTVVTYTSSVAHGLTNGQVITITGFATFTGANLTGPVTVTGTTSFTIPYTATTGTASSTGSITGYVYYTTAAAHNLIARSANRLTISGLSTTAFNLNSVTVAIVPSTTVFAIASTATGTAVSSATGPMTLIYANTGTAVSSLARVLPYNGKGYVNQPKSLSTVHNSTSTTQSSGKFQQVGGLPLTAAKWDGVYAPIPHLARVDTKATGAYKSVRQPV